MIRRGFPIGKVFFLAIVVFIIFEISLVVWLAEETNWLFAFLLCLATAAIGSALARRAGLSIIARAEADLAAGRLPAAPLVEGLVILLGGAFLITPGLISDLIGISALIPACRRRYGKWALAWLQRRFQLVVTNSAAQSYAWQSGAGTRENAKSPATGDVIDVEFEEIHDPDHPKSE